jgi:16S rRNA (uracil1498-N3)-methyltransferase
MLRLILGKAGTGKTAAVMGEIRAAVEAGPFRTASIMTGAEGGFSDEEAGQAEAAGLKICTLGRRILRCETAPLAALAALMYAAGEF